MKQKYACRYGATNTRKCLVPFSGNGYFTCRLYELGQCHYDERGKDIATAPAPVMHDLDLTVADCVQKHFGELIEPSEQRMKKEQELAIREAVAIAFCNEEPTYEAAIRAAKESGLIMSLDRNRIDVERIRYEVILAMV